jgi:surface polysaccharide O-acyltransferase-like enzyme
VSGYFFGRSFRAGEPLAGLLNRYLKRLFMLFTAWSFLYFVLPINFIARIKDLGFSHGVINPNIGYLAARIAEHPLWFLSQGTKVHLWFLPALMLSLCIVSLFVISKKEKYLIPLAFIMYSVCVVVSVYLDRPGLHLPFEIPTRNGPFYSTFFVAVGFMLSRGETRFSVVRSFSMIGLGLFLMLIESYALWRSCGQVPRHDFLFGTIFYGLGFFMLSLALMPVIKHTILSRIGALSSGIYVCHYYAVGFVRPLRVFIHPVLWQIVFPVLALIVSAVFVAVMRKNKVTRVLVT